jgi:GNAT superfamily N-acetyltransferase
MSELLESAAMVCSLGDQQLLRFEPLTADNFDACIMVIAQSFSQDEPVNHCLGITPAMMLNLFVADKELYLKYCQAPLPPLSYVVYDTSGKVVAGFLNHDVFDDADESAFAAIPAFAEAYSCLGITEDRLGRSMSFGFSGVLPEYRGQGLQSKARRLATAAAKARGYMFAVSAASSLYSQKSLLKLGAVQVGFVEYATWRDSHGDTPFAAAPEPHKMWAAMQLAL